MPLDPNDYGPVVASLLHPGAAPGIAKHRPSDLFGAARSPEGAMSGLWLYHDCFDEAHKIAQDLATVDGSFWHGILHRREPDPGNAAYWFRRVGRHPVFPALRDATAEIIARRPGAGLRLGPEWDPFQWIDYWEEARRQPGTEKEAAAMEIQRAEWELLFDWCARPPA
jgi:hypothetical protein